MINIDEDVKIPDDENTNPVKKKVVDSPAKSLLFALKFIKLCQKKSGTTQQQYCSIGGNWAVASNDILTIGVKIEEDLIACPQTTQFEDALKKVGEELAITQLSENSICVTSGAFKAIIPCVALNQLSLNAPDIKAGNITDSIKDAFKVVGPLATQGASTAAFSSVLLQANSAVATNGHILVEYWHGIDLPPDMLIPKEAVTAILKCGKSLTGFGYSGPSATFWFEDDSFIKTQLYNEHFVNYEHALQCDNSDLHEIPNEFFKAISVIKAFTRNGIVYLEEGQLSSNELETEATTYKIEGLPKGISFNCKYLLMIKSSFKKVNFDIKENKAFFFGDNVRGLLMGIEK